MSALYVFDPGPEGSIGDLTWVINAKKAGRLPLLIVQGVLLTELAKAADVPLSGETLLGAMAFGWGLFNFVEGVLDHHVLHLHHVVERLGVSAWDWAFLDVGGIGLMAAGWAVIRSARRDAETDGLVVGR